MFTKVAFFVGLTLFFLAAGTSWANSTLPPDNLPPLPSPFYDTQSYVETLEKSRSDCGSEGCRWWFDYIKAKALSIDDPKSSCELFSRLSEIEDFPLRVFAFTYRGKTCISDKELASKSLAKIKTVLQKENLRPWGIEALNEGGLYAAIKSEQWSEVSQFASNFAKLSRFKRKKIEILQSALEALKGDDKKEWRESVVAELYQIAPHLKPLDKPQPQDWVTSGLDAMSVHDYAAAARAFEKVRVSRVLPTPTRRLVFENLKTSYKALQRKDEAFKVSKNLYLWELSLLKKGKADAEQAKHVLSSGLGYAKFLWTEHKSRQALGFLTQLEQALAKKNINLSELFFVRARINEELKKTKVAGLWMKKAIEGADPVVKGQYGWTAAWMAFKENHYLDAEKQLEELQATEIDQGRKSQEMFWLGKSLESLKRPADAKPWFERIIQEDPLGYYALVAYRELGRPIPRNPTMDTETKSKIPRRMAGATKAINLTFQWLISTGEIRWAQTMLDQDYPLPDPTTDIDEGVFQAYSQAAYFVPIFSRISKISPAEKEHFLREHSDLLFPRLFRNAVEQATIRSGMWPSYLFAIMRQESSFDPLSISGANAYGLLQLLPNVAQALAKKSGIRYQKPEDLLDPTTNVMLGALHLRNYWEQFGGQFILTTAAYNASPQSVKTWVKSRYRGDPLVFIEDIPYEETRIYVKLVLRNFIHYLRTSSEGASLSFPEWCLEGIHTSKE